MRRDRLAGAGHFPLGGVPPAIGAGTISGETMRLTLIAATVAALAACTQGPAPATQETLLTASATVEAVNQTTRAVQLRDNAGGGVFTVQAGPEVRNLAQLEAGDQVNVDYYQATPVFGS